jgi:chromosomal replication initiator protein
VLPSVSPEAGLELDLWADVLRNLARSVRPQCFETWFRPITFEGHHDSALRLTVPTETFKSWLLENYSDILGDAVREAAGEALRIEIAVARPAASDAPARRAPAEDGDPTPVCWNPKYTFDSFVVGTSNQLARAAAHAVAERPSQSYNPLFIYGGVGLGKTHLMHAIGKFIGQNRRLEITYMSSERFMNELVNSIRYDRTIQFRQKYRSIDVLLMDDIQFIAGKERTQEEFFHTFNALYDDQKQIVITSDCPPRQIPTIEERLQSRFQWGLIADIQPPDLETKIAILKRKAEADHMALPDGVAMHIASNIRSSIRDLEGALIRLAARASLDGVDPSEVDVDYAREVLRDIIPDDPRAICPEMIIRVVAAHFGLKPTQLKSRNNSREIALPRQIAMYACKQITRLSLPQIGRDFGGKHHTTVLHSIRKIETLKRKDPEILATLNKVINSFK